MAGRCLYRGAAEATMAARGTTERAKESGERAVEGVERAGNRVSVPFAWNLGLADFVRETVKRAARDEVFAFSGNIAFRGLFALFPGLIALLWLLNVLRAEEFAGTLVELAETAMPETASGPIRVLLSNVTGDQARGAFTAGALFSVAVAVWALSGMTRAMMVGMNAVYGVKESRPFWKSAGVSLGLAVAVTALLVGALFLVVFGGALAERLTEGVGLGAGFRLAWELVTWAALAGVILATCALIYYVAPDVEQRFAWISMGAIVATVLWLLFSVLYSFYVNRFASYEDIYGALAGIVVLMAYFYACAIILLLGAEMNQLIEESNPGGKNQGGRMPGDVNRQGRQERQDAPRR
jgi:membrane protein